MKDIFRKSDIVLIVSLFVTAVLFNFILYGGTTDRAVIKLDGETVETLNLSKNQSIIIDRDEIYVEIVVESGKVFINESSCPDKLCVRQGKISGRNQSLVCLPNRLVVEITGMPGGGDEPVYDAIAVAVHI